MIKKHGSKVAMNLLSVRRGCRLKSALLFALLQKSTDIADGGNLHSSIREALMT
jgi:hypothetical protein